MAAFVKFEAFSEALSEKKHNLDTDTLKIYLSNTAPNVATMAVKADLAEITNQNGYAAPVDTQNATSRTGGVTSVTGVDVTITASGGVVGPFRYVVLFNDDATSDELIGYWDYGSSITLNSGEPFLTDFGSSMFTVT